MVDKYPKRKAHIAYKELEEENELLLVDEKNSEAHVLNAEAGGVWLLCSGNRSEKEIMRILKESMPSLSEREIESHLKKTIEFLVDAGLLE